MSAFLDATSEFAVALDLDDVPDPIVHEARRQLVDTVGVILAGMSDPVMAELAERLSADSAAPRVRILGTTFTADPMWAALVHGTAGVWHDFDAGNRFAGGHPSIHSLAAAISTAAGKATSGRRFLETFIAGYEIGARVGRGTTTRPAMHPHGTWATVGAAVTAALLDGHDASGVREAMNVSSSLTFASSWQAAFEGATVRNVFAGAGAASGVLASELVGAGVTGERDGIATVFGGLSGTAWDPDVALEALGDRWELRFGYTKLLASARYVHPAVDALLAALAGETAEADAVEAVEVETFDFAATMTELDPATPLAAKFSIPHSIAAQLVLDDGGIDAFEAPALADERIRALARRVVVSEDPAMTERTPDERAARVVVRLRDGRTLVGEVDRPHGDTEPVADDAVRAKFVACATRALDADAAATLLERLWSIEEVAGVDELW